MDLFLFIVVTILFTVFIFSFLLPTPLEEEEEEFWDTTEVRLESLLQGVMDPRLEIREHYRNRILAMGPDIIPRLTHILSQELFLSQNPVRIQRLQELILDFGLRALPSLLYLLHEEGDDPLVARGVVEVLQKIGSPSISMVLERMRPNMLEHLIPLFLEWGAPALRAVLKAFQKEPERSLWQKLLLAFQHEAAEPLMEATKAWSGASRSQAFQLLAKLAPAQAMPLFLEALEDESPVFRAQAACALGKIGDVSVLEQLLPLLNDPQQIVRIQVIPALSRLGEDQVVKPLQALLQDALASNERLQERLLIMIALADFGHVVDEEVLEDALGHQHQNLRFLALDLILRLSHERCYEYLERLLWDADWRMVRRVIEETAKMESPEAASLLLECVAQLSPQEPRFELIEDALIKLGENATLPLVSRLNKKEPLLASMALRVLLQGADFRAVEGVLELVFQSDDPELTWGVELDDLFAFFQRVANQHEDLFELLLQFLGRYPNSDLAPSVHEFLEELPRPRSTSQTSLALDPKTPKV